jgi:hypothetical protein
MTHRNVDVVLAVAFLGDGEQRSDRPALEDVKGFAGQTPLDILRAAEVRLDPPA